MIDRRNAAGGGPSSTPDAVIFDMDGTLVDSGSAVPDAFIATVARLGGPALDRGAVIAQYAAGPPAVILSRLLGRPLADDEEALYERELAAAARRIACYAGIAETVERIARVLPVAVFTGASAGAARIVLGRCGLLTFFRAVVGGDDVARPKPSGEGVLLAAHRLGVDAARTCYVGDSPLDLLAAKDAGALAVGAGWGHQFDASAPADVVLLEPKDLLTLCGFG